MQEHINARVYEERQKQKEAVAWYREQAQRIYGGHGLQVLEHSHVHVTEGGAFVEVVVWIPEQREEQKDAETNL